jgi:DNA-binding NarL/FixJ family response regulator
MRGATAEVIVLEPRKTTREKLGVAVRALALEPSPTSSLDETMDRAKVGRVRAVIADIAELRRHQTLEMAVRALREIQPNLPIIMTTEADDLDSHRDAMAAGANRYLTSAAAATAEILATVLDAFQGGGETEAPAITAVPSITDVFDLPDASLRSETSGRWDARRIADAMDVELKQLARAIEAGYSTVAKTSDGDALQPKLAPFANVLAMAMQTFAGDAARVRMWLRMPQPLLGGKTTLEGLLTPGKASAVEAFVENAWMGIPE